MSFLANKSKVDIAIGVDKRYSFNIDIRESPYISIPVSFLPQVWCGIYYTVLVTSLVHFATFTLRDVAEIRPDFVDTVKQMIAHGEFI